MGQALNLTPETIELISNQIMDSFKEKGLVIVPEHYAEFTTVFVRQRNNQFKKYAVTASSIVKWQMLDTRPTKQTIKNMVKDGRIGKNEHYLNDKGHLYILVSAIERLNSS